MYFGRHGVNYTTGAKGKYLGENSLAISKK